KGPTITVRGYAPLCLAWTPAGAESPEVGRGPAPHGKSQGPGDESMRCGRDCLAEENMHATYKVAFALIALRVTHSCEVGCIESEERPTYELAPTSHQESQCIVPLLLSLSLPSPPSPVAVMTPRSRSRRSSPSR